MITLIKAGWVAAWDGAHHRVIRNGEVAFDGDSILYVGAQCPFAADEVVEDPNWFVCPGFINLHGHIGLDVMASVLDVGRGDRFAPSLDFVERAPLFLEPSLSPTAQQQNAEISLVQMVKSGATTIVDAAGSGTIWWLGNPPEDEAMLVETVGRIGARAYLSLSYRSGRSYQKADGSRDWHWDEDMGMAGLSEAMRFAQEFHGAHDGRVQVMLCPHAVDNCSPDLLSATRNEARQAGLLIQIHTAQYAHEVDLIRQRYGDTPVGHLHNIGFLGPDIILGHCIFISGHPSVGGDSERDLRLIADAGSSVAHSPLPFARSGDALYSLPRYLDHGITVGIGCDIWPADIISEMKLAWFLGKHTNRTAERPTCLEVFTAATVGSANALGRSDLGRLAPGAKADIVCVDLSGFHVGPVIDPIRSLVAFCTGRDVARVYVDGKVIVDEGKVLNADEEALRRAAHEIQNTLYKVAAQRDPLGRTVDSILQLEKTT
ncbi:amidohydrolase family protein [bacterium]|nr:amidohydrolase family protein [bacterium]